jgi:hypothetical protein
MANIKAIANGNWSATSTWSNATIPSAADVVYSNNYEITIDIDATANTIRNDAASVTFNNGDTSCAGGGVYILNTGKNLTANLYCGNIGTGSGVNRGLVVTSGTGNSIITGNLSTANANLNLRCLYSETNCTIRIIGNITANQNTNSGNTYSCVAQFSNNNGNLYIGTSGTPTTITAGGYPAAHAVHVYNLSLLNIVGNVYGNSAGAYGVWNQYSNINFVMTGNIYAVGSSYGVSLGSSSTAIITGNIYNSGNQYGFFGSSYIKLIGDIILTGTGVGVYINGSNTIPNEITGNISIAAGGQTGFWNNGSTPTIFTGTITNYGTVYGLFNNSGAITVNIPGSSPTTYDGTAQSFGTATNASVLGLGPGALTFNGNIAGSGIANNSYGIYTGSATPMTINGNVSAAGSAGIYNNNNPAYITVTGNVWGGTATNAHGLRMDGTPTAITINGGVSGGNVNGALAHGVYVAGTTTNIVVYGNISGGLGGNGINNPTSTATHEFRGSRFASGPTGFVAACVPKFITASTPPLASNRFAVNGNFSAPTYVDYYTTDNPNMGAISITQVTPKYVISI